MPGPSETGINDALPATESLSRLIAPRNVNGNGRPVALSGVSNVSANIETNPTWVIPETGWRRLAACERHFSPDSSRKPSALLFDRFCQVLYLEDLRTKLPGEAVDISRCLGHGSHKGADIFRSVLVRSSQLQLELLKLSEEHGKFLGIGVKTEDIL